MFSFFLLDFLFMKLNEEKWKRPFSKFTFNRHQHKMSIRQQWKNDQGSKGWRSGESNRPPPSAVARASNPGVDAICEWLSPLLQDVFLLPLFRFSLLLKNRHSTFNVESMGTFAQVFHNVKVLSGKKKNPNLQFYIRPPLRMDSFGKPKRRDEAKEISFKKFQKSATKHDAFVIKRQRQAFVRFLYHSMVLTTVKLSPNF